MTQQGYRLTAHLSGEVLVVEAEGKFDREVGLGVLQRLQEHQGPSILNLSKVEYISSSGVAMLVKLSATHGVRLSCPSECVPYTLGLAGILRIVTLYTDDAAALNAQPDRP